MAKQPDGTMSVQFADGFLTVAVCAWREFQAGTDQNRELKPGLTAIFAVPEKPDADDMTAGGMPVQPDQDADDTTPSLRAMRFDLGKFTVEQALQWMNDYSCMAGSIQFSGEYVERDADLFEAGLGIRRAMAVTSTILETPRLTEHGRDWCVNEE